MADQGTPEESMQGAQVLQVHYIIPDDMPQLFSDLLVTQYSAERGIFYLSFFQSKIPVTPEEQNGFLDAHCVARLALTPQVMLKVVDLLQRNVQRYHDAAVEELAAAQRAAEADEK